VAAAVQKCRGSTSSSGGRETRIAPTVRLCALVAFSLALVFGVASEADAAWTVDAQNRAVHDGTPVFLRARL
jgi:hypothetical protein